MPTAIRASDAVTDSDFPLLLLTGRVRDQWHTMTRTARAPRLMAQVPEPYLAMHPSDTDLTDGTLVRVRTRHGAAILRLRHDPGLRRGTIFAPMHWTSALCPAGRINPAVTPAVDPVSGQPELKLTPATIAPYQAGWHGFVLARRNLGTALADWTCVVPLANGIWRHELAGPESPAAALAAITDQLDIDRGWMRLDDDRAGRHRAVRIDNTMLHTCVFIGADHVLPPRSYLADAFGGSIDPGTRITLLAGFPACGPAASPMICVCHGVDAASIGAAIRRGCRDVAAVGAATLAGTGCGSCRPEIAGLLATERLAAMV